MKTEIVEGREYLKIEDIERLLRTTYWAANRPIELIRKTVENSACFGLFVQEDSAQAPTPQPSIQASAHPATQPIAQPTPQTPAAQPTPQTPAAQPTPQMPAAQPTPQMPAAQPTPQPTGKMIGFARVITDYATSYYLCDVIIDEAYRGRGLGTAFVKHIVECPELRALRGILVTKDAQALYRKFGFEVMNDRCMEKPRA